MTVKSPLGDLNNIKFVLSCDTGYDALLELARDKLFPNGVNPVVGMVTEFITLEVVNGLNVNIRDDIEEDFTVETYIRVKMV
jgi:hypothetical protein